MDRNSYLYPEYVTRFYNTVYDQNRSGVDLDYFLDKMVTANGPVLEVGVGTGRMFFRALDQGADVYGLDNSAEMLDTLRARLDMGEQYRLSHQDVRDFMLDKKFQLIVAPFRVFAHLLTVEDQLKALNCIYQHLLPGGTLIFDLYVPNLEWLVKGLDKVIDFEGEYEPGKKLRRITSAKANRIEQINEVTMTYEWEEGEGWQSKTWHLKMRYYFRYELELLIKDSPLSLTHMYGGYREQPLDNQSRDFVIVCRREA